MSYKLDTIADALKNAVSSAYEGMSFTEIDLAERVVSIDSQDDNDFHGEIKILLPFEASLHIFIQREIVKNILEETIMVELTNESWNLAPDLVSEYLNVIAGQLMVNLLPENQEFKLGFPETKLFKNFSLLPKVENNSFVYRFEIDGHYMYCYYKQF